MAKMKWKDCFKCIKCKTTTFCKGHKEYDRQCTKCRWHESPTSGTLFHLCKLPLLKAFYITYYVSTNRNGISSTELSRKLDLRQKTCWLFKQKAMKVMESSQNFPLVGQVEVAESYVGGQDDKVLGRNEGKKKIMVVGIEKIGKGENFKQMHRVIMMFKSWLRGTHHSVMYLQPYINEYTYRFNRHKMKKGIFENPMRRMVDKPPYPHKEFML